MRCIAREDGDHGSRMAFSTHSKDVRACVHESWWESARLRKAVVCVRPMYASDVGNHVQGSSCERSPAQLCLGLFFSLHTSSPLRLFTSSHSTFHPPPPTLPFFDPWLCGPHSSSYPPSIAWHTSFSYHLHPLSTPPLYQLTGPLLIPSFSWLPSFGCTLVFVSSLLHPPQNVVDQLKETESAALQGTKTQ